MHKRQLIRARELPRHVHRACYAAVVLSGRYEEAGDDGRFLLSPGNVLIHGAFQAHLDRFWTTSVEILNIPLSIGTKPLFGHIADPDMLVRLAEKNMADAAILLFGMAEPERQTFADWPDQLAAEINANSSLQLSDWARRNGLSQSTVSRGFRQVFGISPKAFRARARGRRAWSSLLSRSTPLAELAASLNFADQAHMNRTVKTITGRAPGAWRDRK